MRHFATESGKSKGQFYTPAEVSRVMAKIIGIDSTTRQDQTVYDPTCGSGSLLLVWPGMPEVLNTLVTFFATTSMAKVLVFALIVVFLQVRPAGLFPQKGRMVEA